MAVSSSVYYNLNMQKTDVKNAAEMESSINAHLSKNEESRVKVLGNICKQLVCDFLILLNV